MIQRHIKVAYAKLDPAYAFDGLFIPTSGKERGRLYVPPRQFGDVEISFQGFQQLGGFDQSILLAITAQLGLNGLIIDAQPTGPISKQLRIAMNFDKDNESGLATKRTSLRSLLIDAGFNDTESGRMFALVKASLNKLGNAQIREISHNKWDYRCNLVSSHFNHQTGETFIAVNPRLTSAVFHGQHVKISLFERNVLESEVAKLLHCWLCSNIRLGHSLGNNGVHIDTLIPHVWGPTCETTSRKIKSVRRGQLRDALNEIADKTKRLQDNRQGWYIDQTSSLVFIARPKELPIYEQVFNTTPSELQKITDFAIAEQQE